MSRSLTLLGTAVASSGAAVWLDTHGQQSLSDLGFGLAGILTVIAILTAVHRRRRAMPWVVRRATPAGSDERSLSGREYPQPLLSWPDGLAVKIPSHAQAADTDRVEVRDGAVKVRNRLGRFPKHPDGAP